MRFGPLTLYPLLGALALGWALGRGPALVKEARGLARPAVAATPSRVATPPVARGTALSVPPHDEQHVQRQAARTAALMSAVAADAAARAAQATVERLVAAGWGPPLPAGAAPRGRRSVAAAKNASGWHLPPSPPPAGDAVAATPAPPERSAGTAAASASPVGSQAHGLATDAYAALRRGDRRQAAQGLRAALAADDGAPQARAWRADLSRLERRWRADAWLLLREIGGAPLAASPVLGAGQAGAMISYTPSPLAARPVSLFARYAGSAGMLDGGFGQQAYDLGAVGVRWQALPGVNLDAERRFGLGVLARDGWAGRLSGGAQARFRAGGAAFGWDGFAEAGGIWNEPGLGGARGAAWYGGAQARVGAPLRTRRLALDVGLGAWASAQGEAGVVASRADVGPSVRMRIDGAPVAAQFDYRVKAAGNARPGSGPAVTISGSF